MADAPRLDRLSRVELLAFQHKALREWRESDWLAEHDMRAWDRVMNQDADLVCVDIGSGIGESEQAPGCIALDRETADKTALRKRTGESRLPDLTWDLVNGLPFEDATVDRLVCDDLLRELQQVARERLPQEIVRVLKTGGTLTLSGRRTQAFLRQLLDLGMAVEEDGVNTVQLVLAQQKTPAGDTAPQRVDEVVLGEHVIRTPRQPTP